MIIKNLTLIILFLLFNLISFFAGIFIMNSPLLEKLQAMLKQHKVISRIEIRNKEDSAKGIDAEDSSSGLIYLKELFDRIVFYFEKEQPYLDPELTIYTVAEAMLSNKIYVSRAIKTFGNSNFPQFVNNYRIRFALEKFKNDTSLRVCELAFRSGFNSPASFTIAFKVNMNMTPGEWCRMYKINSVKQMSRQGQEQA